MGLGDGAVIGWRFSNAKGGSAFPPTIKFLSSPDFWGSLFFMKNMPGDPPLTGVSGGFHALFFWDFVG